MTLAPRLDLRQSQSLVMTPQLQQAISLLQLSNLELEAVLLDAAAANPLLNLSSGEGEKDSKTDEAAATDLPDAGSGDGESALDLPAEMLDRDIDTGDWQLGAGSAGSGSGEGGFDSDFRASDGPTLAEHLHEQLALAHGTPAECFIARQIIGRLDEAGYLTVPLEELARDLGISMEEAEAGLKLVHGLEPTGVGARDLAECISLQLAEQDRMDPCIAIMLANLDLLARGNFAQLKRMCRADDEDLAQMIADIRSCDPRPGHVYGVEPAAPVVPDVLVSGNAAKGWLVSLNRENLPRLVVDRAYHTRVAGGCKDKGAASWLNEQLADANRLVRALDQRQRTILKVAREIVKRQEGFFLRGVGALVPLTRREIAEATDLHESTVSRVTANKFLHCARGSFELRFFFASGVSAASSGSEGDAGAASAEAVKAEIKALIDAESADAILSDDALVTALKEKGFAIARRTVAKYREAAGLGSSVQRRRAKALARAG
ncbi:RNA polymerase factor sigma-54 [Croceicoccus mobilis]|uniref:RNA polymerase sigma-54 factor n=1 Tax=Croceicoccus mobilis TaxID=1703339 RepID=A0A917DVS8_9SPHN|nr:RNA polymerase factor sigma-54 [Croceicoccus mobilis]GGD71557.1 RNA polymerase sigma-54 factor [Croceicoccus mobilis]